MTELTGQPDLRLEMRSHAKLLSVVRAMVSNFAERIGFAEGDCAQISLAVDEALSNVINHGYGRSVDGLIWVQLWHVEDPGPAMGVVVEDMARQVDPATIQSRDLDDIRPGGLGVHLIRHIMDHVRYETRQGCGGCGMRLTMIKHLDGSTDSTTAANTEVGSTTPPPTEK
jgi:serine/threonine-protein kinase RsbW